MSDQIVLSIADPSQVADARRTALHVSHRLDFDETQSSHVSLVLTELATNILKHASGGEILLSTRLEGNQAGVELLALDRGPGIQDIPESLRDGYSTAGTSGTGLGAIRRLSTQFDLYSPPTGGTAVLARVWSGNRAPVGCPIVLGAVCLPKRGEEVSGDGWTATPRPDGVAILVVDGLGHGMLAHEAASKALRTYETSRDRGAAGIFQLISDELRPTRGAVAGLAEIDLQAGQVRFMGVGNVAAVVVTGDLTSGLLSHYGTLGVGSDRFLEYERPWSPDSMLVMHTDGLAHRWDLSAYPGLRERDPSLIAAVLYRDFHKERDDVTVVVAKHAAGD